MDTNYREFLAASPYLEEGVVNQFIAKGAGAMQGLKGRLDMGWKPIDKAKMESLWGSFIKRVQNIVKDFNVHAVGKIQKNAPADLTTYQSDIKLFSDLGKALSVNTGPVQFTGQQIGKVTTPRNQNDPSHLGPTGVNQDVNWDHPEHTPKKWNKFSGALQESALGALIRPWSLQKAHQSNDTNILIGAYKAYIKKLYTEFLNDVEATFKIPQDYASRHVISKTPEVQPQLNTIEKTIGIPPTEISTQAASQPVEEPTAPAPEPEQGTPQATGEEQPPAPPAPPSPPQGGSGSPSAAPSSNGSIDANLMIAVMRTIVNRLELDPKAGPDSEHKYLSTPITTYKKEKTAEPPDPTIDFPDETSPVTEADGQQQKDFLYQFGQYYRKHTGSFTVSVGVFKWKNDETIEVMWHSFGAGEKGHGHINEILLKIYRPNKPTTTIRLFRFYDHEVDPRYPASSEFNIKEIFEDANPNFGDALTPEDITKINSAKVGIGKYANENLFEMFHRACFAVTDRKTLEEKVPLSTPKEKEAYNYLVDNENWNPQEALEYVRKAYKYLSSKKDIKTASAMDIATNAIELKKMETGEDSGFFTKQDTKQDAVGALITLGWSPDEAVSAIEIASAQMGPNASTQELIAAASSKNPEKAKKFAPPKPAPTPAPTPAAPTPPAPTTPEPQATAPADQPTPKKGQTPEEQLAAWNDVLKKSGLDTLDNVQQLTKFFSVKGSAAQHGKITGKHPIESEIEVWKQIVAKAKGQIPTSQKKKKNPPKTPPAVTENGFINPYVSTNFIH